MSTEKPKPNVYVDLAELYRNERSDEKKRAYKVDMSTAYPGVEQTYYVVASSNATAFNAIREWFADKIMDGAKASSVTHEDTIAALKGMK